MTAQRQLELLAAAPRYAFPQKAQGLTKVLDSAAAGWRSPRADTTWEGLAADAARASYSRNATMIDTVNTLVSRSALVVTEANHAIGIAAERYASLPSTEIPFDLLLDVVRGVPVSVSGYGVVSTPADVVTYARWMYQERERAAQEALDQFRATVDPLTSELRAMSTRVHGVIAGSPVRAAGTGRRSLDDILEEYQVSDDPDGMTEWPGWPLSMFTDPVTMTQTEADMLDRLGLYWLFRLDDIRDEAFAEADARIDTDDQNDDHNDAFRHAYWNARMAALMGEDWAEGFGTAHEGAPANTLPAREAMDLYNNEVGRRIATDNPDASDEELVDEAAGS